MILLGHFDFILTSEERRESFSTFMASERSQNKGFNTFINCKKLIVKQLENEAVTVR